jgi:hypothetical protein
MNNQRENVLLFDEKQANTIFCHAGEEFFHIFSLIERISKQQLLSTYHNHVSLRIKCLERSRELNVRLCAAHLQRHIIGHVSALMFRRFRCFGETTRQVVVTL